MPARKKSSWGTWIIILVIFAAAGGAYAWRRSKASDAPLDIKTATPVRGDIVQSVTANGQILPLRNIQVGSQVSGIIKELMVDFNSKVTNGQVIAQIDPSTYQQNISQAEAELADAKAQLTFATINHTRAKQLSASGLIPPSDYDKTIAELEQAQARLRMREAALTKTRVDLERTTIYAPVDGIVISRVVDVGQTVAASLNAPTLFQIAHDLRQMRIEAMVSEADVGGVSEGQEVSFTVDAFPTREFKGIVSQVRFAPITNQNVVNYTAVVDVPNEDLKLRPGMTATASIITAKKENVLRIPNSALRFRPPENLMPKGETNKASAGPATASRDVAGSAGGGSPGREGGDRAGGGGGGGRQGDPEEWRRRMEAMTPEEREAARTRFAGRRREQAADGPVSRTIYLVDKNEDGSQKLRPVSVKTGVADSGFTEVVEGLKETDLVAVALNTSMSAMNPRGQGRSPFGGSPFGGGGGGRPR